MCLKPSPYRAPPVQVLGLFGSGREEDKMVGCKYYRDVSIIILLHFRIGESSRMESSSKFLELIGSKPHTVIQ